MEDPESNLKDVASGKSKNFKDDSEEQSMGKTTQSSVQLGLSSGRKGASGKRIYCIPGGKRWRV